MHVAVIGAGAVGLAVAAKLSTVCDVHAVCRKRHVEAIASRGFEMTGIVSICERISNFWNGKNGKICSPDPLYGFERVS